MTSAQRSQMAAGVGRRVKLFGPATGGVNDGWGAEGLGLTGFGIRDVDTGDFAGIVAQNIDCGGVV